MKTKTISSDQARAKWRELLDTAAAGEPVIIARYGKPVAVLVPYQDYVQAGVVREETAVYQTDKWAAMKAELAAEIKADLLTQTDIRRALLQYELQQLRQHELDHLEAELADVVKIKSETEPLDTDDWATQIQHLQQLIAETGGEMVGLTKDEIVERMRQTRQEIFEAEYAHLYR